MPRNRHVVWILPGFAVCVLLLAAALESGVLFTLLLRHSINMRLQEVAPQGLHRLVVGRVRGGVITGIRLENLSLEWRRETLHLNVMIPSLETGCSWMELLFHRWTGHAPVWRLKFHAPHLEWVGKGSMAFSPAAALPLLSTGTFDLGRFGTLRSLEIQGGRLTLHSRGNGEKPLHVTAVHSAYRQTLEREELPLYRQINRWIQEGNLPEAPRARSQTMEMTGLWQGHTPLALNWNSGDSPGEHLFTLSQPWPDRPLSLRLQHMKDLVSVNLNWGRSLHLDGIIQDSGNLRRAAGVIHKQDLLPSQVPQEILPFPFNRFARLKDVTINEFTDAEFLVHDERGDPELHLKAHFGSRTLSLKGSQGKNGDLHFTMHLDGQLHWSGSYAPGERTLQTRIRLEDWNVRDALILTPVPLDIDLQGHFNGQFDLYGALGQLSLEGSAQSGSGRYGPVRFHSAYLGGKGTGRHFYLDENARIQQKDGHFQVVGFVDFGNQANIFQNVKFIPHGAIRTEKVTLLHPGEKSPQIQIPLIPDLLDLSFRGSEDGQRDSSEGGSVNVKMEKSFKF